MCQASLPTTGVAIFRALLFADDLRPLLSHVHAIGYPTRFLCGQSDEVLFAPPGCHLRLETHGALGRVAAALNGALLPAGLRLEGWCEIIRVNAQQRVQV